MEQLNGKALAEATAYALNSYSFNEKAYADSICRAHRTIQQSWMRMVAETCRVMAEGGYDDRNEGSHRMAEEIAKLSENIPLPLI